MFREMLNYLQKPAREDGHQVYSFALYGLSLAMIVIVFYTVSDIWWDEFRYAFINMLFIAIDYL